MTLPTTSRPRLATGALVLPGVLAITAGFVDAVAFLHLFGVFPANQSGNLVLLGMAFASAVPPPAWVSAISIIGFTAGTAGGAWLAGKLRPAYRQAVLLSIELVLLVGLAVATASVDRSETLLTGAARAVLLLVASLAMGVQTETIRRVAGVAITTTYETGTMARLGETLAGGASSDGDHRRRASTVAVLAVMVLCYVGGAAAGASGLGDGRAGLVIPCLTAGVVLIATLITTTRARRPAHAAG